MLLFSGAQLHASTPNTSGRARYSVDFRTVNVPDLMAGRGAPLVDVHCTGTAIRDFINVADERRFDEQTGGAFRCAAGRRDAGVRCPGAEGLTGEIRRTAGRSGDGSPAPGIGPVLLATTGCWAPPHRGQAGRPPESCNGLQQLSFPSRYVHLERGKGHADGRRLFGHVPVTSYGDPVRQPSGQVPVALALLG